LPHRPIAHSPPGDQRHDLLVDGAGKNHFNDLDGLLVGDAKTLELRFNAHLVEHRADLQATAMYDDRIDARLLQQRDIARESLAQSVVAHGMAAIFHDNGLVLVTLHVRQRARQQRCLGLGRAGDIGGHQNPRSQSRGAY
jgi:hypothetical protein